ncbi:MAG: FAD-linked oxidase C-terminal domain-containing protein, partial [Stackebrandtia sp.]
MSVADLAPRFAGVVGPDAVITDHQELRTYECDGLTSHAAVPGIVVLPTRAEQIARIVAICVAEGVPYVARGSGTGLSGGALPRTDGVLIVTSKLRRVLDIDVANRIAVVEPGVVNLAVTRAASPHGYYYAPDPSSQQICSIGGNVAENSGGAHCLKYGFTVNHVLGLQVVTPDAELVRLGGRAAGYPGYDLLGAFVGSEGTLGIATEVTVRLLRAPEDVATLLAAFDSIDAAGSCVSQIIGAGIIPAAIEMMDAAAIEAVEAAVACDYPAGAAAVLIVEVDGPAAEVAQQLDQVRRLANADGAFELRVAADDAQRAAIWKGRKSAFAAIGHTSPSYIVQDGVVPRTALPRVLGRIDALSRDSGIRVANVFHAGDGNLHPLVMYDDAVDGEAERAEEVS